MYLILTETKDEFTRMKAILGSSSSQVTSRHDVLEALHKDPSVKVIVIAPSVKADVASSLAAEFRVDRPLVNIILVRTKLDIPTLTAALGSGIKDVIDAQDATGLVNAVERCESVTERIESLVSSEDAHRSRGKVITIYSAKGGCGKTTVSSNLAAALAADGVSRICLVDLDLQFGDVAASLRINPTRTISHTLNADNVLDADEVATALVNYQERFDLLLAPANPADIERISPDFISRVVTNLQSKYDFVVIDTSPSLSEVIIRVLQESDLVVLLTTLDMPAIKNLRLTIDALDALGLAAERRMIVLNRADLKVGLEPHDVEELVGHSIAISIPSSTKVSLATNRGELIVDAYPANGVSKAILQLSREVRAIMRSEREASLA